MLEHPPNLAPFVTSTKDSTVYGRKLYHPNGLHMNQRLPSSLHELTFGQLCCHPCKSNFNMVNDKFWLTTADQMSTKKL